MVVSPAMARMSGQRRLCAMWGREGALARARSFTVALVALTGVVWQAAPSGVGRTPSHSAPGLTVGPEGTLLKDGKPYRGMGINYFSAFYDALQRPAEPGYRRGFRTLAERGIPFVRFAATAFWPGHMELYLDDREAYFEKFDALVRAAEGAGVGLIPSMFWHAAMVPDLVGEPRGEWGNPGSKTRRFMRTYTEEVVTRYRDSPAIWGWEFGNEYNLAADLPNAARHRPPTHPALGTPETRTERDDLTGEMIVDAFIDFARTVRRFDRHRALFSGNSRPRPSAYHNWTEGSWTIDTREQFARMLQRDNPDPIDTLTIHLYAGAEGQYFPDRAGLREIVRVATHASRAAGKPLFVGEFGASRQLSEAVERQKIRQLIDIIEQLQVPLSAVWVFELPRQEGTHNITADNGRSYILNLIARANARMGG